MYGHICLGIPKLSNATIFNDLERPLTQISRSSHHSTLNISNNHHKTETYNGILTGIYTRCTQGCHFEWPWVTRSIARPLCDSWDSCIALIPRHGGGCRKKGSLGESKYRKGGGEHDGIEKKVTVLHLDFCLVLNVSCVCVVCFGHC